MKRLVAMLALLWTLPAAAQDVAVGSKKFTESVILGEILRQVIAAGNADIRHRRELGGTRVLWEALKKGDIDLYPEYTGTIAGELLAGSDLPDPAAMRAALRAHGIRMTAPLGFNNTYAIGVMPKTAETHDLKTISDLRRHPNLALGFSNEFMDRADGWPALRARYRLPMRNVRGLDHDLAYRGLAAGDIDAIDVYTTDAEIAYYGLRVLEDDLKHFPAYEAVVLYRSDLATRLPEVEATLGKLEGLIDGAAMAAMNAAVKIEKKREDEVAAAFVQTSIGKSVETRSAGLWERLGRSTLDHLVLVGISLGAAIAISIPLGIVAAANRRFGQVILGLTGILQTIPSLALFVFMIPFLGIGGPPAIVALFLYSLLPIVRNTQAGLLGIDPAVRDSARAMGLTGAARLRLVELPLAMRSIMAGIKTSAVINIGTATLGALIGAGGYGQPILTGIRLDDTALILEGAIPAAAMALVAQGLFELAERAAVPRGLRLSA